MAIYLSLWALLLAILIAVILIAAILIRAAGWPVIW
jgi:hypothetical protein